MTPVISSPPDSTASSVTAKTKRPFKAPKQVEAIAGLRTLLGSDHEQFDDGELMRFIVARSYDLPAAKTQLLASLEWRKTNKVDDLPVPGSNNANGVMYAVRGWHSVPDANIEAGQPNVPEHAVRLQKYMGGSCLHKWDKAGRPIYIERMGQHNVKGLAKNVTTPELVDYHIRCSEFVHQTIMPECEERFGVEDGVIDKETVIFDCTGMGFHQLHMEGLNMLRSLTDMDQKAYPERLGKLFIVNSPYVFVKVYSMIKKWLDPGVIEKIHILGKDYKDVLLEHIDSENLPDFLGGACTCGHMPGGCVPSEIMKNIKAVPATPPAVSRANSSNNAGNLLAVPTYMRPRSSSVASANSIQDFVIPGRPKEGIYQIETTMAHGKDCEYEIVVADEDVEHEPEVVVKFRVKGIRAACGGLNFTVVRYEFGEKADSGTIVVPTTYYDLTECPENGSGVEVKFRAKHAGLYVMSWKPENQRGLVQMEYGVSVDGILGEQTSTDSP
ncbi:cytosolic factor, phosphatidylinositol/phosphatidylcholine transfer protein [Lunasporangiospora selenospora]|uniref:Cytosolic factor, phosphatidylinositol/phosphatidylcholine transfer protein n=1 Tax=Lunasporangiospora selenospora TaxID=979761 RepID=A0A9P6KDE5_9FUNG|nr:cytosolic factor, phosphatidylinositol/phosphatidylcholine transfer protein [Lunasporangiospora selenospora]